MPGAQPSFQPKPVYWPAAAEKASHVYVEVAKKTPLGPNFDGPFEILERINDTSIRLKVGEYTNGQPRTEVRHWHSCQPYKFQPTEEVSRPTLGRPRKT